MSYIDVLLERIADPTLRGAITEELAVAKQSRRFGLVFERHLPESVETPGVRPRPGDRVTVKLGDKKRILRVVASKGEQTSIVEVLPDGTTGETETVPMADLVVVREFNDPIYAGMKQLGAIHRGGDKPAHTVIRGENYHALEALLYTHEEKVDVIYIDPPYNTGSDSWIYNDRYVDGNDGYRHSKWLAFMERRLLLAKRLLKDTGVIILAIDDNEHARLKLLCDDVFGEANFIANVVWQGGTNSYARFVSVGHDYMFIYGRNVQALGALNVRWREQKPGVETALEQAAKIWTEAGGDHSLATKTWRSWIREFKHSGIATDAVTRYVSLSADGRPIRTDGNMVAPEARPNRSRRALIHPVTNRPCAVPENGWRYSDAEMDRRVSAGLVAFGPDEKTIPSGISYLDEMDVRVADGVFEQSRTRAGKHLEKILGSKDFPFPKDVDVLARWINIVSANNPDAVELDFFAGTGTTAEAVMRLNAQDGGRRQSIIVTNNELASATAKKLAKAGLKPGDPAWEAEGVFEKVTWPRIETVVTGVRRDGSTYSEGLAENVRFLELTYEDDKLVALGRKFKAVAPLLWLKAGGSGGVIDELDPAGFAAPADACYAILFDTDRARELSVAVQSRDDIGTVFIVSDSDAAFQAAVRSLPNHGIGLQTVRLYSNYLRSFQINTQGA